MQLPVTVLNANTKREQGKKAQLGNIAAAKVPSMFWRWQSALTAAPPQPLTPRRIRRPWPTSSEPRWARDRC
jgi:hypothetical protein